MSAASVPAGAPVVLEEGETVLGLPSYRYPTGWFVVAFSHQIAPGEVKPLHYFGQDLVAWRSESGQVHVFDAYCQHLGAHIGYGGKVVGEEVMCPWHGWQWGPDGCNTYIPYSKDRCKSRVKVYAWPTQEWYGHVLVWHDRHRRAPTWQPPVAPELEGGEYYPLHPHSEMVNRIKAHPQNIVENAADPFHVVFVHHGAEPPELTSFEFYDDHLHATVDMTFGGGKPSTWLTPNGPVRGQVVYDTYGIGLGFVRFPAEVLATVQITGHTPVDETYTDYFFCQSSVREPGDVGEVPTGRAARFLELQKMTIAQDFPFWEHMSYLPKPNFATEEARDYAALRRWCRKFYPPEHLEEAGANGANRASSPADGNERSNGHS
jgi:phenylpropionate dioxygenase-like ring-hydroxylating dioxygenase large terminal subunit